MHGTENMGRKGGNSQANGQIFYVVGWIKISPAATIEPLSEQLNRRLCAVELFGGHVDIVHEQDELLARRGTEYPFPSLLAFAIDEIL